MSVDSISTQRAVTASPFHAGELAVQRRLGVSEGLSAWASQVVRPYLPEQHREFYGELPFLVAAARDDAGSPWATLLTGRPGFATSADPREMVFATAPVAGDALERAFVARTPVGLLGIDLATRRRNRVNGWVSKQETAGALHFEVGQSFGNCPQYIREREWTWVDEVEPGVRRSGTELPEDLRERIARAETFFIATGVERADAASHRAVGMDASHRGGPVGFVRVEPDGSLLFPDYAGNNHYNTFGNLEIDPRAGLLFVDFESGGMLQLTGHAEVLWDDARTTEFDGAQRLVRMQVDAWRDLPGVLPLRWVSRDVHRRARVVGKVQESRDVTSFLLESIDHRLPLPHAGQYVPLLLEWSQEGQSGRAERTYSLSGRPQEGLWRISVRRHERGLVSRLLHDAVAEEAVVRLGEPAGDFVLPEGDRPLVLIAGGIGITPLLAMLHELDERRDPRQVLLLHSVPDAARQPFAREIEQLAERAREQGRSLEVHTRFTRIPMPGRPGGRLTAGDVLGHLGHSGLGGEGREVDVLLCGPPAMVRQLTQGLEQAGLDPESIHSESF